MKEQLALKIRLNKKLKYTEPKKTCLSCGPARSQQPRHFGLFYGMLLLMFFGYAYVQQQWGTVPNEVQTIGRGRTIQYTRVEEKNRQGVSLLFQNNTNSAWHIKAVSFNGNRHEISVLIDPGGFHGAFIPTEKTDKQKLFKFSVEEAE